MSNIYEHLAPDDSDSDSDNDSEKGEETKIEEDTRRSTGDGSAAERAVAERAAAERAVAKGAGAGGGGGGGTAKVEEVAKREHVLAKCIKENFNKKINETLNEIDNEFVGDRGFKYKGNFENLPKSSIYKKIIEIIFKQRWWKLQEENPIDESVKLKDASVKKYKETNYGLKSSKNTIVIKNINPEIIKGLEIKASIHYPDREQDKRNPDRPYNAFHIDVFFAGHARIDLLFHVDTMKFEYKTGELNKLRYIRTDHIRKTIREEIDQLLNFINGIFYDRIYIINLLDIDKDIYNELKKKLTECIKLLVGSADYHKKIEDYNILLKKYYQQRMSLLYNKLLRRAAGAAGSRGAAAGRRRGAGGAGGARGGAGGENKYYLKYLKYKTKYLELKKNLI